MTSSDQPAPAAAHAVRHRLPSWWPLAVLMVLAAAARFTVTDIHPLTYPDSTQYLSLAREIGSGAIFGRDFGLNEGFASSRKIPPLYSLLIAPFTWTSLELETVGSVISLAGSVLALVLLYALALLLFNRRAAIIAGAMFVLHPFSLLYAGAVLTESVFAALFLALILAVTRMLECPTTRRAALAGAVAAALTLTRDVGFALLPLVPLAAAARVLVDRQGWRPVARAVAIFFAVFLLVSLPWFIHIRVRTGHFGLTARMDNAGLLKQVAAPAGGMPVEGSLPLPPRPMSLADRVHNFIGYGSRLTEGLRPPVVVLALAMLIIGLVPAWRQGRRGLFNLLWLPAWVITMWAAYAMVTPQPENRYLYPLMAPGIILAAAGAELIARLLSRLLPDRPRPRQLALVAVAVALCGVVVHEQTRPFLDMRRSRVDERRTQRFVLGSPEAAHDLITQGLIPPGSVVMDRKPFLPYYLSARWHFDHQSGLALPDNVADIEKVIATGKVDFIAFNSYAIRNLHPKLLGLSLGLAPLKNCRVIYSRYFKEYERMVTVYRVGEEEPPLPAWTSSAAELAIAYELEGQGQLLFALRRVDRILAHEPDNSVAWNIKATILSKIFQAADVGDQTPTIAYLPDLLPSLEQAAANYLRLNPADASARPIYQRIADTLARERMRMTELVPSFPQ